MLGLKLPTDPRWVDVVEKNIEDILTDHVYCEQKAASYAISLITKYPEITELVDKMTDLAQEELGHLKMVHQKIKDRGLVLGWAHRDPYVHDLLKFIKKGGDYEMVLVERLLIAAMIEARSCERFRMLSEQLKDKDLAKFYHNLMISEARHYTMFLKLAHKYAPSVNVDLKWKEFLEKEAKIITSYGNNKSVHG